MRPGGGEPIRIRLTYLGPLRHRLGRRGEELHLPPPVTVRKVLDELIAVHGSRVDGLFYNQYGWLDPRCMVLIDGERSVHGDGLAAELTGTEDVQLVLGMPMSGG